MAVVPAKPRAAERRADEPMPLLSIDDLAALPPPRWLIDGMLPAGGFVTLYGPSGAGKSFLALDWALCTAAGIPWYGRQVRQGSVLFVAAEGVGGLYRRVEAWLTARSQAAPADIRFAAGAVNLLSKPELDIAKATLAAMDEPPRVIVIDTMARSMVGGDENAARDVGLFIAHLDDLARPHDATRIVVHHTGKTGDDERGSSALRGASDTMVLLKPDSANLLLACEKQKDAEPFERWTLHLQQTAESCVIRCGTHSGALGPSERQFLEAVSASFGTGWATSTAMRESSSAPSTTYYRLRKALIDGGYLEVEDEGRTPRCRITALGLGRVPASPSESHGSEESSPTIPAPLRAGNGTRPGTHDTLDEELERLTTKFGDG